MNYPAMFPFESDNEEQLFVDYHPRNHLYATVDDEFMRMRKTFAELARELQARIRDNQHSNQGNITSSSSQYGTDFAAVIVNYMGSDMASIHLRILQGLCQDIEDAIGLKSVFISCNESNLNQEGDLIRPVNFEEDVFLDSITLDGELEQKWNTLVQISSDSHCRLIITLGGMYESMLAPCIATHLGIKSLLYKTNDNAIPFNQYDYIYSYSGELSRSITLYDVKIADRLVNNMMQPNGSLQLATAMRLMDSKIKDGSPMPEFVTSVLSDNSNMRWAMIGCDANGSFKQLFNTTERIDFFEQTQTVQAFAERLLDYDIFYHPPEHPHGGVATVYMAYLLGCIIVVTEKNDSWGLIEPDEDCYTDEQMNQHLTQIIEESSTQTPDVRYEQRIARANRRINAYYQRRDRYLTDLADVLNNLIQNDQTSPL